MALTTTGAITKIFQGMLPTDMGIAAPTVQSQGHVKKMGVASAHVTGNDLDMGSWKDEEADYSAARGEGAQP